MRLVVALALLAVPTLRADEARFRLERRYPGPRGVLENLWAGDEWAFFNRWSFRAGRFGAVLLTEKDPGEEWGDLAAGGLSWAGNRPLSSIAGGYLRMRSALGLTGDHGGFSTGGSPLSLAKPPVHREVLEPATSPGDCDGEPLTGAGAEFRWGGTGLTVLQGISRVDPSGDGLHRSSSELDRRGSVEEWFSFARLSGDRFGLSGAMVRRTGDSSTVSGRAGLDLSLAGDRRGITGEACVGFDGGRVSAAFLAGVHGDDGNFRHALTVGRYPSGFPAHRSSRPFGSNHDLAAGYGIRWRPGRGCTLTSGLSVMQRGDETVAEAGLQGEESPFPRTALLQKLTVSDSREGTVFRGVAGAAWSPGGGTSLTLRLPCCAVREGDSTLLGAGAEFRVSHRLTGTLEVSASAAAADTEGYASRVYVYRLSFPGEFGSCALYGRSALLQASLSVEPARGWRLRFRIGRFHGYGRDSLGSGYEQTEGPSRTDAGLQLDWKP